MPNIKHTIECESCDFEFSVVVEESLSEPTYCPFCAEELEYPDGYIVDEIDDEAPAGFDHLDFDSYEDEGI